MSEARLISFENPVRHQAVSELIRRHSSNREDVRRVALGGLDLSVVHEVLDLGCGFGFMAEAVAPRVAPDARLVGVDACPGNEEPFLERVARAGRKGEFRCRTLDTELLWPREHFDLVVASYSFYFFPEILPEVSRVLTPDGVFFTITHAETSCRSLLRMVGYEASAPELLSVIGRFSAENGARVLAPWFGKVERIDYENGLIFEADELSDLLAFLHFKMPSLVPRGELGGAPPPALESAAMRLLGRRAPVTLEKNDAIFRCREPRCP